MKTAEKLILVKEMLKQPLFCCIILLLKKIIAVDSNKQKTLDAHQKLIQQTYKSTEIQSKQDIQKCFFIFEEVKETAFEFPQEIVRVLKIYFDLI